MQRKGKAVTKRTTCITQRKSCNEKEKSCDEKAELQQTGRLVLGKKIDCTRIRVQTSVLRSVKAAKQQSRKDATEPQSRKAATEPQSRESGKGAEPFKDSKSKATVVSPIRCGVTGVVSTHPSVAKRRQASQSVKAS